MKGYLAENGEWDLEASSFLAAWRMGLLRINSHSASALMLMLMMANEEWKESDIALRWEWKMENENAPALS